MSEPKKRWRPPPLYPDAWYELRGIEGVDAQRAEWLVQTYTQQFQRAAADAAKSDYYAGERVLANLGFKNPPEDYKQTAAYFVWKQGKDWREELAEASLYFAGNREPTQEQIAAEGERLQDPRSRAKAAVLHGYYLHPSAIPVLTAT